MAISSKIQFRRGTAAEWAAANALLAAGELGFETDTRKFKIGDGSTLWNALAYAGTIVTASAANGNIIIDGTETTVYTLPNDVPHLDVNGKLPESTIPALAIGF